ncbi:MAG: hypothetical protein ACREC6_10845, partial [Hyphomicrobiaceae bacterium]
MSNTLGMATQLVSNALRFGWYYGVGQLAERQTKPLIRTPRYRPVGPVPPRSEILADMARLFLK